MADTVKTRAKRYALAIARRKYGPAWARMPIAERMTHLRPTASLLALARINLAREENLALQRELRDGFAEATPCSA